MDRYDLAERGGNEGLWDWNLLTNRIHYSPRWISMLGCEESAVGNNPEEWFQRIHPEDLPQARLGIQDHLAGSLPKFESHHRMLHQDGTYRWMACQGVASRDENGQPVRMTGSHFDITAEKVTDALTGLPNRILLMDRLARSIERAKRHGNFLFAVLLLDLDRFKPLIERLGRAVSDQLLIAVARRLETCLRSVDTVARLGRDHVVVRFGEDEFIILLDSLNEISEAKIVAERLLKEVSSPFELAGHELFLTASIGIALSVTGYNQPEGALRDADIAMYRAKALGRARCEVFDTAILESAQSRLQLEADLSEALQRQEFSLYYQPIVSLAAGQIAGFEALVRWNHPTRGMVPPLEFIPFAEKSGLIVPLGRWVLEEACRQLKDWQENLGIPKDFWVSVNIASTQFKQPSFVQQISEVLNNIKLEPQCLMLELTESMAMENPGAISSVLMQLRVMGVQIGLDDFGTGYSSLGYLRQFPLDYLKIDQTFVQRMGTSKDFEGIVRTIRELAQQLGLKVIAEGIENTEQLNLVRSLQCEYGQGMLSSGPVNREKAGELLKDSLKKKEPQLEKSTFEEHTGKSSQSPPPTGQSLANDLSSEEPHPERKAAALWQKRMALFSGLATVILLLIAGFIIKSKLNSPHRLNSPNQVETPQTKPVAIPPINKPEPQDGQKPPPKNEILPSTPAEPMESSNGNKQKPLPKNGILSSTPAEPMKSRNRNKQKPLPKNEILPSTPAEPMNSSNGNKQSNSESKTEVSLNVASDKGSAGNSPQPFSSVPSPSQEFLVIHQHVFGSCKGSLNISHELITFVSEGTKDSFTLKHNEFSWELSNDQLTIKSGSKIYRFKPASTSNKADNLAQLQKIGQSLSSSGKQPRKR